MDVAAVVAESISGWTHRPGPADPAAVEALAAGSLVPLPAEYLELLRLHDGGEGNLGAKQPGWFQLWPVGEVATLNRGYGVVEYLPGFFGFGSDGGGELLALDCRGRPPWPVVIVPFIPLEAEDALPVAADFAEFVRLLGRVVPDVEANDGT
ncbi:MAG: SMI1/KNR4 family protein [Planctomycetia bacterium]